MTDSAWRILCESLWHLTPHEGRTLWFAIQHSRWSRPTALRQALSLVGVMRVDLDHLCARVVSPASTLQVIEDLVQEGGLRRQQAARLTETILASVGPTGGWRGDLGPPQACTTCTAPDVRTLAMHGMA
jgi:hypothetical protein